MEDLKPLLDHVTAAVTHQDGTWQSQHAMLKAIDELRVAAMGPAQYIMSFRYQPLQNMCIVIALELGLLGPIVARKGQAITADELVAETGSEKLLIVRVMRMLTAIQICDEVDTEQYTSNANTECLSVPHRQSAMRFMSGPTMRNISNVVPYMRSNGGTFIQFPDSSKGQKSSAEYTFGMPLWDLLREDPEIGAQFSAYLGGRREGIAGNWYDIYPTEAKLRQVSEDLSKDQTHVLLVDIGGNIGYDLEAFQKRFPAYHGRLILQDLPENIVKARKMLGNTGIEAMEYDFFTPQPVKGATFYTLNLICHDWPDDKAKKILSNTASAMDQNSTLILTDMTLPDKNAPLNLVTYDVLMMLNVTGIERTVGQFKKILDEVGLELVNVWPSVLDTVLEIRLKRSSSPPVVKLNGETSERVNGHADKHIGNGISTDATVVGPGTEHMRDIDNTDDRISTLNKVKSALPDHTRNIGKYLL